MRGWGAFGRQEHAAALKERFPSLVRIAEVLLRAKEAAVRGAGAALYTHLFTAFSDAYHRQEILGALVGHTGAAPLPQLHWVREV